MSRPFILVGDKTDHGGTVIQGSTVSDVGGIAIARVGDKVTCPQRGHRGTTTIATGDPTCIIDGQPAARHGDKTACGATLISSQATSTD
ncbi:MAG: PAAR domain-containing protein [Caldimonas sp.]